MVSANIMPQSRQQQKAAAAAASMTCENKNNSRLDSDSTISTTEELLLQPLPHECIICSDTIISNNGKENSTNTTICHLQCCSSTENVYHAACLQKWLQHSATCPLCRRKVVDLLPSPKRVQDRTAAVVAAGGSSNNVTVTRETVVVAAAAADATNDDDNSLDWQPIFEETVSDDWLVDDIEMFLQRVRRHRENQQFERYFVNWY